LKLKEKYRDVDLVVSHWDTDGVVSACLMARAIPLEPHSVVLSSIGQSVAYLLKYGRKGFARIAVLDLNLPERELARNLSKVMGKERLPELIVVDHHSWSDTALTLLSAYSSKLETLIYPSYPSASRIIVEAMAEEVGEYEKMLASLADDDDLFTNTFPVTSKLRAVLRWSDWRVRRRVLEECVSGALWSQWLERTYQEIAPKYRAEIEKSAETLETFNVGGLRVAFLRPSQRVHPGDLQLYLESRNIRADIYFFLYERGLSIRSSGLNVDPLVRELGGGGHARAGGVSFEDVKEHGSLKDAILGLVRKLYKR